MFGQIDVPVEELTWVVLCASGQPIALSPTKEISQCDETILALENV